MKVLLPVRFVPALSLSQALLRMKKRCSSACSHEQEDPESVLLRFLRCPCPAPVQHQDLLYNTASDTERSDFPGKPVRPLRIRKQDCFRQKSPSLLKECSVSYTLSRHAGDRSPKPSHRFLRQNSPHRRALKKGCLQHRPHHSLLLLLPPSLHMFLPAQEFQVPSSSSASS